MESRADRWLRWISGGAAMASAAAVIAILAFLIVSAIPFFRRHDAMGVIASAWRPYDVPPSFGIGPMAIGSLSLAFLSTAFAFPLSLGICVFALGIGSPKLRRAVLILVRAMTAIPTVVYGFVAVILLVPAFRALSGSGTGYSLLTAGVALSLLIIPTMVLLMWPRMKKADDRVAISCAALGMTRMETICRVVAPMSRRALVTGLTLGFSRALGDTMMALMVAGNTPQIPASLTDSVRTLTAQIALVLATDWFSPEYQSVAAAGLALFVFTALLIMTQQRVKIDDGSSD